MGESHEIVVFLVHDGRVLLVRQGNGPWNGLTTAPGADARAAAHDVLRRELGLDAGAVELIAEGSRLAVGAPVAGKRHWLQPMLFGVTTAEGIHLAGAQRRWVWPGEIDLLETAPGLAEALQHVYR